ncbi:MAG: class I SAM-dependent methyltransferase [Bacteroidales bacterium]|nr:class I SAM-dependent methyltransferase [Bacteroidales bacterium]
MNKNQTTKYINITFCPLCGAQKFTPVFTCTDYIVSQEQFQLYACDECSFLFTQDFPSENHIDSYYESENYIAHSNTRKGLTALLYHWVRSITLRSKAKLIKREYPHKPGVLLDFGAGNGHFAHIMQKKHWEVEAFEKNKKARTVARARLGMHLKEEKAIQLLAPNSIDVITLWHVMEHLEDINGFFQRFHELLIEQGLLILAVPNHTSYDATYYKQAWAAYDVPRHLWHFSPITMQKWGAKHGFVLAAHYPMYFDGFYVSILSEKNQKHFCSFLRGFFVGLKGFLQSLARKEKSSSMIYVFRKKH